MDDDILSLRQKMKLPVSLITMSPAAAGESSVVLLVSLQFILIPQHVH